MGDGDVRLSPLLGAYLGWLNPGLVPVGLFFGFFAGAVVGVAMMAAGRAGRKTAVPFGPFLALGTIVADLRRSALHRHRSGVADRPSSGPVSAFAAVEHAVHRLTPGRRPRSRRSTPTNMIMIGSNMVVNFLIRLSSSRSK